ncbi:hypothetical protein I6A84_31710 [Frankia sp. CNm7]|uniref:Tetratricopeptide repeat protein n=1 Tax=Frankia nepalensis TaxID=1836974 RepID=A0A937RR91_9ACTN|nr:hypothetical protein [Frankia nepalensis]MBL7500470.1 hypothetical protein [Frankia nepalensis]MBL7512822.1 hypothetical protein [Frankia nepalensis]MBL7522531.1 hypothetical protein [Frankia nepalensis]MBL7631238.1 hypothetical protein [Frankia nepalensis]
MAQAQALVRKADGHEAAGRFDEASRLSLRALDLVRQLREREPDVHEHARMFGATAYTLGAKLAGAGRRAEAVAVLGEAEKAYESLPAASFPARDDWVADVRARRALGHAHRGARLSALEDLRAAFRQYRSHPMVPAEAVRTLGVAAQVQAACGDPGLALACAKRAVNLALTRRGPRLSVPTDGTFAYFLWASDVMRCVLAAQGEHEGAAAVEQVLVEIAGGPLPARMPTLLGDRLASDSPPDLTLTLTAALDAAEREGADVTAARRFVRRPRDEADPVLLPGDRADRPETAAVAAAHAVELTGLARRFAGQPAAAARLVVDAHHLFLVASEAQTLGMRYQFGDYGPHWATALLACCRQARADGDLVFAVDLGRWMVAVAERLMPFASVHPEVAALVVDCVRTDGQVLVDSGDVEAGRTALATAARIADRYGRTGGGPGAGE